MHGIKRILVFCTLTTILPIILLITPLYLRHNFYANVAYAVTDSDILEITDGISTIFCSAHTLQMNRTFNAFQMTRKPEITSYKKHIRLKKSMTLPDDTMEYWGFYVMKGASVALSVCSRFQGASILVVKGEQNLRTCGMLEHHNTQAVEGIFLPEAKNQVKVTFTSDEKETSSNNSVAHVHHNNPLNNVEDKLLRNTTLNNTDGDKDLYSHASGNVRARKENEKDKSKKLTLDEYIRENVTSAQETTVRDTRRLRHAKNRHYKDQIKERRNSIMLQERESYEKGANDERSLILEKLQRKLHLGENREDGTERGAETEDNILNRRIKRNQELVVKPSFLLDQGVKHGGNAGGKNATDIDEDSSVSSFENELLKCYGGSVLITQEFAPSEQCTDVNYLTNGKHMQAVHNVVEDGYYYYIFYSDNDIVSNDIYALFDIYKPIFHYENVTKSCINQTKCSFSINLLSSDRVIVEIPTEDGHEYEMNDVNLLLSICHPRMEVYIIFPVAVLFFILACAFM